MTSFEGGLGAAQLPPDELAANQASQRQDLENKLHGDIREAEEQQHSATEKGARDLAATGDVESPGANFRNTEYEAGVQNTMKHQRGQLGAQMSFEEGSDKELKARLALVQQQVGEMATRPEMASTEMESPWTGWPEKRQPRRIASGLLDVGAPLGEPGAGVGRAKVVGNMIFDTDRVSHKRRRCPSAFVEKADKHNVEQEFEKQAKKVENIPKVIEASKDAHDAQVKDKHLRETRPDLAEMDHHSEKGEAIMESTQKNFRGQLTQQVKMDEAYGRKLKAIQDMHGESSEPGKGLERPQMMSAESTFYKDRREVPDSAKWGETERPPKGLGPEIGYGIEKPLPFQNLDQMGEIVPRDISIAKFPGYAAEALPDEMESLGISENDGNGGTDMEAMGGASDPSLNAGGTLDPSLNTGSLQSMPLLALHAAVLAPRWVFSASSARSRASAFL